MENLKNTHIPHRRSYTPWYLKEKKCNLRGSNRSFDRHRQVAPRPLQHVSIILGRVTLEAPCIPLHRVKVCLRPHFIQAHYPSGTPSTLILQSSLSKQIPLASSSPIFLSAHALLTPSFHLNGGRPLPLSPSTSDL